MHFIERLFAAVRRVRNPVVVGIDPRPEELPPGFLDRFPGTGQGVADALRQFGIEIIDVLAPMVSAVKFQSAFYEAYGPTGVAALHASVEHARSKGLIAIIDGKRNDIGSTAEASMTVLTCPEAFTRGAGSEASPRRKSSARVSAGAEATIAARRARRSGEGRRGILRGVSGVSCRLA